MAPKPKLLISSGSKKKSPGTHVWMRPKPRTHIECDPRFPLPPRTSYTRGCQAALVGRDVEMSPQSVTTHKKASYNPGLNPIKGHKFALVPRLGPKINSRGCFWVSLRPCHWALCWLVSQWPSFFCKSCLGTPRAGSGPRNIRAVPPLVIPSAISLPCIPTCPGTQKRPTACWIEISFKAFWHWWTKGDVLTALRAAGVLTLMLEPSYSVGPEMHKE